MSFEKLLINLGEGWNLCTNQFVAPRSGVYFLSKSAASMPDDVAVIWLQINETNQFELPIYSGYFSGSDTASQSVMISVKSGDTVNLYLSLGILHGDANYQLSFLGFLYEPSQSPRITWSLGFPFDEARYFYGPTDIIFQYVFVNEG